MNEKEANFDDHYKVQPIEPITVQEQVCELLANVPMKNRLHIAQAIRYLMRAGNKSREPWQKDVKKAFNYLHRTLHGEWVPEHAHVVQAVPDMPRATIVPYVEATMSGEPPVNKE